MRRPHRARIEWGENGLTILLDDQRVSHVRTFTLRHDFDDVPQLTISVIPDVQNIEIPNPHVRYLVNGECFDESDIAWLHSMGMAELADRLARAVGL